jgi:hypothetical protein
MEQTKAVNDSTTTVSANASKSSGVNTISITATVTTASASAGAGAGAGASASATSCTSTSSNASSNTSSIVGNTIRPFSNSYASSRYDTFDEYENLTCKFAGYERDIEDEYYDQADDYDYDGDWN